MKWMIVIALVGCGRPSTREQGPAVTMASDAAASDAVMHEVTVGGEIERAEVTVGQTGRLGVHGMVIFGTERVFVSHVPMFHEPHDVQLVARVRVVGARTAFDELYTIAPEQFRLDDVLSGKRTGFRADLFRGNFEDGGQKVGTVDVEIDEIVVARPLGGGDDGEYYLVGGGEEWWAIHRIGAAPSFDAIAKVRLAKAPRPGRYRSDPRLAKGVVLEGASPLTDVREVSCLTGPDFTARCPR